MKTNFKKDLKTIIKQILLEIGVGTITGVYNYDEGVQKRMYKLIKPYEKTDPEKYQELKKLIEKDVVGILFGNIDAANKPTGTLPPAARSDAERAEMRKWNR